MHQINKKQRAKVKRQQKRKSFLLPKIKFNRQMVKNVHLRKGQGFKKLINSQQKRLPHINKTY